jgi:hypothetical protein
MTSLITALMTSLITSLITSLQKILARGMISAQRHRIIGSLLSYSLSIAAHEAT